MGVTAPAGAEGHSLYSLRTADGKVRVETAPGDAYVVAWLVAEGEIVTRARTWPTWNGSTPPGTRCRRSSTPAVAAPLLQPGVSVEVAAAAARATCSAPWPVR
ncbi:hypothetical protein NKG94_01920 [Micromonospora sp. M12]